MIEQAIYQHLRDDPDVAPLAAGRVYFGEAPQAAGYPLVQFFFITPRVDDVLSGPTVTSDAGGVYQFDSYAERGAGVNEHVYAARRLDVAVGRAMTRFRGVVNGGVRVQGVSAVLSGNGPMHEADVVHFRSDFEIRWRDTP